MDFYVRDLYPSDGIDSTRTTVQPEAADQQALVDDQKIAVDASVTKKEKLSIFAAFILMLGIGFVLGMLK